MELRFGRFSKLLKKNAGLQKMQISNAGFKKNSTYTKNDLEVCSVVKASLSHKMVWSAARLCCSHLASFFSRAINEDTKMLKFWIKH